MSLQGFTRAISNTASDGQYKLYGDHGFGGQYPLAP